MSTLREHIEEILTETTITEYQQPPAETLANIADHAIAVMAILDFKPLDSDLPRGRNDVNCKHCGHRIRYREDREWYDIRDRLVEGAWVHLESNSRRCDTRPQEALDPTPKKVATPEREEK